jgi:hypothetical protein
VSRCDALFDDTCEASVGADPFTDVVASASGSGVELAELLTLEPRTLAIITPRAEEEAATRQRLLATARGDLVILPTRHTAPKPAPAPGRRRPLLSTRGVAAAAAALALGGTVWSVNRAAGACVPGDVLYLLIAIHRRCSLDLRA